MKLAIPFQLKESRPVSIGSNLVGYKCTYSTHSAFPKHISSFPSRQSFMMMTLLQRKNRLIRAATHWCDIRQYLGVSTRLITCVKISSHVTQTVIQSPDCLGFEAVHTLPRSLGPNKSREANSGRAASAIQSVIPGVDSSLQHIFSGITLHFVVVAFPHI
jgi:hypothetical protein